MIHLKVVEQFYSQPVDMQESGSGKLKEQKPVIKIGRAHV